MTREEAVAAITVATKKSIDQHGLYGEDAWSNRVLMCLESLGLVNFDAARLVEEVSTYLVLKKLEGVMVETKKNGSTEEIAGRLTHYGAACVVEALSSAGLEIRRKA